MNERPKPYGLFATFYCNCRITFYRFAMSPADNNAAPAPAALTQTSRGVNGSRVALQTTVPPAARDHATAAEQEAAQALAALRAQAAEMDSAEDDVVVSTPQQKPTWSWWTLKNKATLLAVALGTLPVLIIGGISTSIAGRQLSNDAIAQQQQFTNAIALQMQDFGSRNARSEALDDSDSEGNSLSEKIINFSEVNELSGLVNQRVSSLRAGTSSESGALAFSVIDERRNRVLISNNADNVNTDIETLFPDYARLQKSETASTLEARSTQDNLPYLLTYSPVENEGNVNNDFGVLLYQPMSEVFAAQRSLRFTLLGGTVLTVLLVSTLAAYLANRVTQPIITASRAVSKLGQGQFETRLAVKGQDELAVLNSNINVMAEQLEYQLEFIQETAQRQNLFQTQALLVRQQQQKREALQQGINALAVSLENAVQGDLTVQAQLAEGGGNGENGVAPSDEVRQLASVINAGLDKLRLLVSQSRQTARQVESATGSNHAQVQQLANEATAQTDKIAQLLSGSSSSLAKSSGAIAANAQQAKADAQRANALVRQGNQEIEQSADSLRGVNTAMAEAANKVRQLNATSQQIHQVVTLLNEISLKTNFLAINASIESRQSSEEPQPFFRVASEIGQLTEQSMRATREIERITKGLQRDIKETFSMVNLCSAQVSDGAAEVETAHQSLRQVMAATTQIDKIVAAIAKSATEPEDRPRAEMAAIRQMQAFSERTADIARQTEATLSDALAASQQLSAVVSEYKIDG